VIIFAVDTVLLTVNISFQKGSIWLVAFFATIDLANGTKQRTFPTSVFTQQLDGKKKTKKNNKTNFINIHSDRRLSVMCMCA
jgi:hypothetical protein